VVQDKGLWRALLNTGINSRVKKMLGNPLVAERLVASQNGSAP
jgi:hypothetical protein